MKTTVKWTAGLVAMIVTIAMLSPQPARAGDREWATAGKILTGVVAANVLLNGLPYVFEPPSAPVVSNTVIRYENHGFRDRPSAHWGYAPAPGCRMYRPPFRGYRSDRSRSNVDIYVCPEPVVVASQPVSVIEYNDIPKYDNSCESHSDYTIHVAANEVYIRISDYKRIYQPRVKGHKAYIQERPDINHSWLTKGEHPSIW